MPQYVKTDNETKTLKKIITKFSKDISVSNKNVRGVFTVKNVRKYQFRTEVDVIFKGEIQARIGRKLDWYDSGILTQEHKGYKISKIKLNRFLRKSLHKDVDINLKYYCETIKNYYDIGKIEWV